MVKQQKQKVLAIRDLALIFEESLKFSAHIVSKAKKNQQDRKEFLDQTIFFLLWTEGQYSQNDNCMVFMLDYPNKKDAGKKHIQYEKTDFAT